jgi:hypothetical protein
VREPHRNDHRFGSLGRIADGPEEVRAPVEKSSDKARAS